MYVWENPLDGSDFSTSEEKSLLICLTSKLELSSREKTSMSNRVKMNVAFHVLCNAVNRDPRKDLVLVFKYPLVKGQLEVSSCRVTWSHNNMTSNVRNSFPFILNHLYEFY